MGGIRLETDPGAFVRDVGHRQRIELRVTPPDPMRSRPLRTGKEFLLTLREQRFVASTWDKAFYDPNEEAQLAVTGKHLGDAPLRLVVEREEEGRWTFVHEESAPIGSDGTEAKVTFRFPPRRDSVFKDGHFTKAEWDRREAAPGEVLRLHVEAEGLESAGFLYVVEREEAGNWVPVADWHAAIHEGKADARFDVPPVPRNPALEARGVLVSATFEHAAELVVGETALAVARGEDLEGAVVCFELEREVTQGHWEPVGWASSSVRSGRAQAALKLASDDEPSRPLAGGLLSAAFAGEARGGAQALLVACAHGLDSQTLQFVLERESSPEQWEEIFTAEARVEDGRAVGRAPLLLPQAKVAR